MNPLFFLFTIPLALASNEALQRRAIPSQGYYDPSINGGSMLTTVFDTSPPGQSEAINMIISGNSDSAVLVNSTDGGLHNYINSLGFAGDCLGLELGDAQQANLGDGNGLINQTAVMRWDYGNIETGTCTETLDGGNHFRYWVQNGSSADSNAIFMAASYELPSSDNHDIVVNGYNLGRDYIIGNITNSTIPTESLSNSSTYSGTTSFNGFNYSTSVQYVSGLLPNTSIGINHNLTAGGIDGLVAVLTVKITASNGTNSTSTSTNAAPSSSNNSNNALLSSKPLLVPSVVIVGVIFYSFSSI